MHIKYRYFKINCVFADSTVIAFRDSAESRQLCCVKLTIVRTSQSQVTCYPEHKIFKKPLTCSEKTITPVYLAHTACGGGGGVYFAPPLSYLWSSACAVHLLFFGTDAHCTAVYTNSFYPVNWITSENRWREQLLPKQLITRSPLVPVHMFLCTCTMLILI